MSLEGKEITFFGFKGKLVKLDKPIEMPKLTPEQERYKEFMKNQNRLGNWILCGQWKTNSEMETERLKREEIID